MEFRFIILTLQSFSLTTLALVDSMTINNVNGNIGRLVRWDRMALHSTLQEVRFSLWLEDLYTDVNKGGGLGSVAKKKMCALAAEISSPVRRDQSQTMTLVPPSH
jgi:hypothetical protein